MRTAFVDSYGDIRVRSARSLARHATLTGLALAARATGRLDALAIPRVQFLYLHHVFSDEEKNFRALIEQLRAKGQRIVSTTEAVQRLARGDVDAPYVAISLDDGFKNGLRAARIMESYDVTGCFYVCPGAIEERDPDAVARFCREALHLPPIEFLDRGDVEALLSGGHEIGNHTMHHARLAGLSSGQLEDEIGNSTEALRAHVGRVDHFAWPYGAYGDLDQTGAKMLTDLGYRSNASAVRGCHLVRSGEAPSGQVPVLRRDHVVAAWPVEHTLYFMASAARAAEGVRTTWPDEWSDLAGDG